MLQPRRGALRHPIALALAGSAMLAGLGQPASADHQTVTAVKGSAYGYSCVVSAFGQSCTPPGPTPTVSLAPDASNSPQTAFVASARADTGPATIFTSGRIDVSTQGALGPSGSVTSSSNIANVNASGQENLTAANLASTCTASATGVSGSTTITGGTLVVDNGDFDTTNSIPDHPEVVVTLPANPAPNTTYEGHLHIGNTTDTFRWVFNEQAVGADGSLTVNAAHEYLLGPSAVGNLILGQVVCGVTTGPAANAAPVAVDDSYNTAYNTALAVPAPGVLGNDTDADGGALTAGSASDPAGGSVTLNADGSFTYTPDAGFSGTDTFTYTVTDNHGATDTGTVTVTVAAPPPPPADVSVGNIADSPDPVAPLGTVTYTIPVTNLSTTETASGVTLLSTLSGIRGASVATATVSGGDGGTCTILKGKTKGATCDLGTIAPGATETVTITVTAPRKTGTMTLTSTVSSAGDSTPGNNTASENTAVVRP